VDFLVVKNRSKSFALHSGTNGTMRDALADDQPFEISLLRTEIDALLIPRRFASRRGFSQPSWVHYGSPGLDCIGFLFTSNLKEGIN
jgi:hypothetical protein